MIGTLIKLHLTLPDARHVVCKIISVFVLIADPDYDPNTSFISVEDVEPDVEMDPVMNGNGKHLNDPFPSKQQN